MFLVYTDIPFYLHVLEPKMFQNKKNPTLSTNATFLNYFPQNIDLSHSLKFFLGWDMIILYYIYVSLKPVGRGTAGWLSKKPNGSGNPVFHFGKPMATEFQRASQALEKLQVGKFRNETVVSCWDGLGCQPLVPQLGSCQKIHESVP